MRKILFLFGFILTGFLFSIPGIARAAGIDLEIVEIKCDTAYPAGPAVRLDWNDVTGVYKYNIYRNGYFYINTMTDSYFYNSANLVAGNTYNYRVEAVNYSNTVMASSETVEAEIDSNICVTGTAPGNFSLSYTGPACPWGSPMVYLDWTAASGATNYEIYKNGAYYTSTANTELPATVGFVPGNSYSIYIRATNSYGATLSNTVYPYIPYGICDDEEEPCVDNDNNGICDDIDSCIDYDHDGHCTGNDCNDNNPAVWDTEFVYWDFDEDGYYSFGHGDKVAICFGSDFPDHYSLYAQAGDCNDYNATINPDALELCDFIDNDCNGTTDEVCGTTDMHMVAIYNTMSDGLLVNGNRKIARYGFAFEDGDFSAANISELIVTVAQSPNLYITNLQMYSTYDPFVKITATPLSNGRYRFNNLEQLSFSTGAHDYTIIAQILGVDTYIQSYVSTSIADLATDVLYNGGQRPTNLGYDHVDGAVLSTYAEEPEPIIVVSLVSYPANVVRAGSQGNEIISVNNIGTVTAKNVYVAEQFFSGFTFTDGNDLMTWHFDAIGPGESELITYDFNVSSTVALGENMGGDFTISGDNFPSSVARHDFVVLPPNQIAYMTTNGCDSFDGASSDFMVGDGIYLNGIGYMPGATFDYDIMGGDSGIRIANGLVTVGQSGEFCNFVHTVGQNEYGPYTVYLDGAPSIEFSIGGTACNDGLDNDNDGLIDMNDPGCESPEDNDETREYVCGLIKSGLNTCVLEPGDMIFWLQESSEGILETTERMVGNTYWGHAEMYIGDGFTVQAVGVQTGIRNNDVQVTDMYDTIYSYSTRDGIADWAIVRPYQDEAIKKEAIKYAVQKANQVDPPVYYNNFPEALFDKWSEDKFYCSQLIWRAYYEQGVDLEVDPKDLYLFNIKDLLSYTTLEYQTFVSPDDLYWNIFTGEAELVDQKKTNVGNSIWKILYRVFSPVDLMLIDEQGRKTGYDNLTDTLYNEIPGVQYTGPDSHPEAIIMSGENENLKLYLRGNNFGNYSLEIVTIKDDVIYSFAMNGISTIPGMGYLYSFDWDLLAEGGEGATIEIDEDGDREFEKTITSDNVLTQDEIILQTEAMMECDSNNINLSKSGEWMTCYVELPEGFDVAGIDGASVSLNGVPAVMGKWGWAKAKATSGNTIDHDGDGVMERMLKFRTEDIIGEGLEPGELKLDLSGEVMYEGDLLRFSATDSVRMMNNKKNK